MALYGSSTELNQQTATELDVSSEYSSWHLAPFDSRQNENQDGALW